MNKYLTIGAITLVVVVAAVALWYVLNAPTVSNTPSTTPGSMDINNRPALTPEQARTNADAARVAYEAALNASGRPDNIQAGKTVVAGGYALQKWVGDTTGGQALLKFDDAQGRWVIVDPGGGQWSAEALLDFGVPQSTAQLLIVGMVQ